MVNFMCLNIYLVNMRQLSSVAFSCYRNFYIHSYDHHPYQVTVSIKKLRLFRNCFCLPIPKLIVKLTIWLSLVAKICATTSFLRTRLLALSRVGTESIPVHTSQFRNFLSHSLKYQPFPGIVNQNESP